MKSAYGAKTMNRMMVWLAVGSMATVALVGCDGRKSEPAAAGTAAPGGSLPADLILTEAPGDGVDAVDVVKAKETAGEGDEVVIQGRIGGRVEPFVHDRAIFQLVDTSIPTCAEKGSDGCPTPWDYCCEPKDQVTAKSATVQVVGNDGKPLAVDLEKASKLAPMDKIIVRGKVAAKPNEATMIVNADSIYIIQ